jgi:hypothetical protein
MRRLTPHYVVTFGVRQGAALLLPAEGACVTGLTFISPVLHNEEQKQKGPVGMWEF